MKVKFWIAGLAVLLTVAVAGAEGSDTKKEVAPSAEATEPLAKGDSVPKVTLHTIDGEAVDLAAMVAEKPTALIFYRGSWCPYCNKHLSNVGKMEGELVDKGYQIVAISPDKPANLMVAKEKGDLNYTLLSDAEMAAAKAFGVAFRLDADTLKKYKGYGIDLEEASGGGNMDTLPIPAFYLIGTDGTIDFAFTDPDYTKRISQEEIEEALKMAAK